jgi:hypothetical protein
MNQSSHLDEQLNSQSPSPHIQRPALIAASCPMCGLPLALSQHSVIAACGNGHIYSYPEMQYQLGV